MAVDPALLKLILERVVQSVGTDAACRADSITCEGKSLTEIIQHCLLLIDADAIEAGDLKKLNTTPFHFVTMVRLKPNGEALLSELSQNAKLNKFKQHILQLGGSLTSQLLVKYIVGS